MKCKLLCLFFLLTILACTTEPDTDTDDTTDTPMFDWQGHRGARGLLPENSIPAFLLALQYPAISTLEMDVAVTQDSQIILSHEPWLSHEICSRPDGRPVGEDQTDSLVIWQMTAAEVQAFDCGSRGNERFAEQKPMQTVKPLLSEVVRAVEQRAGDLQRPLPAYNIEIKSRPDWDGKKTPDPETFARLLLNEIDRLGIAERSSIQSFDVRALEAVHSLEPEMTTVYLIENTDPLATNLEKLSFQPKVYSPYYLLVSANLVREVHDRGMQLIPWTVNDTTAMLTLMEMGVDGIITDYPNRIPVR